MDLSRLLQICHLWGTASLGQLFTVHGRICNSALVYRQMITAMIAGILASVLLAPARSIMQYYRPAGNREREGALFVMLALRSLDDWASMGRGVPQDCQPCIVGETALLGRVKHHPTASGRCGVLRAAGPLPTTPAAAGEDSMYGAHTCICE